MPTLPAPAARAVPTLSTDALALRLALASFVGLNEYLTAVGVSPFALRNPAPKF